MMVIRGGSRREARATFGGLIRALSGATGKPQSVKMGGERSVVIMPGATPKQSWAWWAERNDLVLAAKPTSTKDRRGAERVIEVLDRKRPGAVEHPILAELAKGKGPFQPVGHGFFVPFELPSDAAEMKRTLDRLGLGGIQRIEYQWGLEDNSLMSVTRVVAPRPRQGLLALYDQPTFEKGDLPPLPDVITGFRVVSLDLAKSLDTLMAMAKYGAGRSPPSPNASSINSRRRPAWTSARTCWPTSGRRWRSTSRRTSRRTRSPRGPTREEREGEGSGAWPAAST